MDRFRAGLIPAFAGLLLPVAFILLTTASQVLYPGFDILRHTLSQLQWGPLGWGQMLAFVLLGFLLIMFAAGLHFNIRPGPGLGTATGLMALLGCLFIVIGLCPTDPSPLLQTFYGMVHGYAATAAGAVFPVICYVLTPSLKKDPRWKSLFGYAIATGLFTTSLAVAYKLLPKEVLEGLIGVHERLFVAAGLLWLEVTAIRLLSVISGSRSEVIARQWKASHPPAAARGRRQRGAGRPNAGEDGIPSS